MKKSPTYVNKESLDMLGRSNVWQVTKSPSKLIMAKCLAMEVEVGECGLDTWQRKPR